MPEIKYHELRQKPIDPNRARWYALGLSAVGALFACLTIKTNTDYFAQYYTGAGFWLRVIPFYAIEGTIVVLPLFKGFGNEAQGRWAFWLDLVLIAAAATHTYLVSDASITKAQMSKTKMEASADLGARQAEVDKIAAANQKMLDTYSGQQKNYNMQMRHWYDAARVARSEGRPAPPAPPAPTQPQLLDVPKVSQTLVDSATVSVELAGLARVSHHTLQGLLFLMVGLVVLSISLMVQLADGTKIKAWFLRWRAKAVDGLKGETESLPTTARNLSATSAQGQPASVSAPPPRQLPPVPPPPGPKIRRFRQVGEPVRPVTEAPSEKGHGRNGTSGKV